HLQCYVVVALRRELMRDAFPRSNTAVAETPGVADDLARAAPHLTGRRVEGHRRVRGRGLRRERERRRWRRRRRQNHAWWHEPNRDALWSGGFKPTPGRRRNNVDAVAGQTFTGAKNAGG